MAVALEFQAHPPRERRLIPLNAFSFHREYLNHDVFEVSITDGVGEPFVYSVREWANMIRSVGAFTESVSHVGACLPVRRDLYQTGYASVNGSNVRVTPIG
ncbi:hypothetical protein ACFV0H_28370 [Streptomyces erythrochromogenes]|uniref:hypothetical protein n=1 Tax=Streptomyces erythrochromogenes TaxID=285574 RepID=UPI00368E87D4